MVNLEQSTSYKIELDNFDLERHVEAALQTANALAADEPITAADLLRAVLISDSNSQAFTHLVSLLPLSNLPKVAQGKAVKLLRLSPGLAQAYSVAEKFFSTGTKVWGRDLVTFVLLADHDPSLHEIANEAGMAVDRLQDEWFDFVTATDQHRKPEAWVSWWKAAGVPLPTERTVSSGSTYLFTWNPNRFDEARIAQCSQDIQRSGPAIMKWSLGARRYVSRGDRVYLLRQGVEPRGLVGFGEIEGDVVEEPHWDKKERAQGKISWLVAVRWQRISTMPIVNLEELIQETGEKSLWSTQTGGVKIRPELASTLDSLLLQKNVGSTVTEALRFAQTLSDFDHKNDWIGIRSDVEALSTLVAVNRVEPPLSIAIFGDWGSGKTFLMRKIQERVRILEQIGETKQGDADADSKQPRYCSSILQIEFNSWHYTESNLWASLVNHIFEKLQEKITLEEKGKQQANKVEKFFKQFETARAAREAAEQQIQLVSAEVELTTNSVNEANSAVLATRNKLSAALGRSVWGYLDTQLEKNSKEQSSFKDALRHFGFEESLKSAQTIYDTVDRFRSVSGRAREVFGSLLATREGTFGAIILAVLVVAATGFAVKYQVPILSIGTAFAGTLAWLAERAGRARKWLSAIQSFDDWFSALKQAQESHMDRLLAKVRADFEQHKEALSVARQRLGEAQLREARAKEDLKKLTAREQMRRFVDERVTTQTYAKHLGLISLIRRDFEDLSDFMYRDHQPGESRLVNRISATVLEAIPTVERIILYIDDLDRCQPERVVEVLEAIHLLLAFRLFIVVVAVDPRWVIESLRRRYPHLSENQFAGSNANSSLSQNGPSGKRYTEATAHDYLEKIFNIPFWVKPMGPEACKSLIAGYLGFSESDADDKEERAVPEAERFHDLVLEQSAQQSSIPNFPLIETVDPSQDKKETKKARSQLTAATPEHSEETITRQASERAAAERKIKNVEITAGEQVFIRKLAPHLGNSPRRIKRYANTYRLLKSGLTQREARLCVSSNDSNDDYRLVLVFLAIITGAPTLAPQIFSKAFALRNKFTIETLIEKAGLKDGSTDSTEATHALGALELLKETNVSSTKIETWVPRVMRYAFRLTPVDVTTK